jgi:pimeloyl-ACP methyl ester carboxylesterase
MPFYERGDVRIHYEEVGSGFPLLLIPGGGLNSSISWVDERGVLQPDGRVQG